MDSRQSVHHAGRQREGEIKMARHKHSDIIHAWADGAEIQVKNLNGEWMNTPDPCWTDSVEYRIKPKIVKREGWVNIYRAHNPEMPDERPGSYCYLHAAEEAAKTKARDDLVATVKVEWEEEE